MGDIRIHEVIICICTAYVYSINILFILMLFLYVLCYFMFITLILMLFLVCRCLFTYIFNESTVLSFLKYANNLICSSTTVTRLILTCWCLKQHSAHLLSRVFDLLSRCQEVLEESEKQHKKPVADSPLTLAEVTGFMAMEVKLQSSLTEQNAKFIKVHVFCLLVS